MKMYNCKVRIDGKVTNEVLLEQLAAPEIFVLRRIHGTHSIVDVKECVNEKTGKPLTIEEVHGGSMTRNSLLDVMRRRYTHMVPDGDNTVNVVDYMYGDGSRPFPRIVPLDGADDEILGSAPDESISIPKQRSIPVTKEKDVIFSDRKSA